MQEKQCFKTQSSCLGYFQICIFFRILLSRKSDDLSPKIIELANDRSRKESESEGIEYVNLACENSILKNGLDFFAIR